jgi:hypothetical protein
MLVEAFPCDFRSCIGGQQLFENGDRHGCSVLGLSFLEGNSRYMAEYTKSVNLTTRRLAKKNECTP